MTLTQQFPTLADYQRLYNADDNLVTQMWQATVAVERQRHCCLHHRDQVGPPNDDWDQALLTEMERRGLSTDELPDTSMVCKQCHGDLECVIDPNRGEDAYLVCRPCKTRRHMGGHMDCRLRDPEPLPEGW
jgi:hypothetical protein